MIFALTALRWERTREKLSRTHNAQVEDGGVLFANAGAYKIVKRNPLSEDKHTFVGFIAHNAHISDDVDIVIS